MESSQIVTGKAFECAPNTIAKRKILITAKTVLDVFIGM
jgi:hypothetical protein